MLAKDAGAISAGLDHPSLLPAVLLGEPHAGDRPPRRSVRDWVVDAIAFLIGLGLGALILGMAQAEAPVADQVVLSDVVLGLIACVSLWWRRRWPVEIGLLTAVLSAFSMMAAVAGCIGLFTVAVHRRVRLVAIVTVANLVAGLAISLMRPSTSDPLSFNLLIGLLIVAVVVAWGMFARARRQVLVTLRERAERAEAEQQLRVAQARQLERTRIAREMHDVLAHRISLISLHAGALEFSAAATPDDASASAAVIRDSAHAALEDLREILGVLRDESRGADRVAVERPQPTLTDLPALIEQSRSAGMQLTFTNQVDDQTAVPASLARAAFRVVQEGLTNAHKHAPHTAATVTLSGSPGTGLDIEIRNRGSVMAFMPGSQPAFPGSIPGAGQGLLGLAERATLAGGRIDHGPTPDGDFRLHAWLPWPV